MKFAFPISALLLMLPVPALAQEASDDTQQVSLRDTVEFPEAIKSSIELYMACLSTSLSDQVEAEGDKVDFAAIGAKVIASCKPVRAQAFKLADEAMKGDPGSTPASRKAVIDRSFAGIEESFGRFVETVRDAVARPRT